MIAVTSVANMRRSDAQCIAEGTPSRTLMAAAGQAVYAAHTYAPPVAVVCGTGNNAGDGYVLAGLLARDGIDCRLFILSDRRSADGQYFFEQCMAEGIPVTYCDQNTTFDGYATVVDCLFGTGFRADQQGVTGITAHVIEAINRCSAFVVSVDINSGLNGDTGLGEVCVHSHLTVSIGTYKSGHFLGRAKDVMAQKCNADIGIPLVEAPFWLLSAGDVATFLRPRPQASHKASYGYLALMGGSLRYSGAAKLANWAACAMRSGAGVVRLAVPHCIAHAVAPYLLESTLYPLPDDGDSLRFDAAAIDGLMEHTHTIAVGMGMGDTPCATELVSYLLTHFHGNLLLDADGLRALAALGPMALDDACCQVFLTPHVGEFVRLCSADGTPFCPQADVVVQAKDFAARHHVQLLLKGATTIVTNGETVYLVDRGCSGMATAGSGDVLSGIAAAILSNEPAMRSCASQGAIAPTDVPSFALACAAYVAGVAGELAQADQTPVSMLAGDTAAHIAATMRLLLHEEE